MKKSVSFILGVMLLSSVHAQLQDRIWIFGRPTSGTTNATLYFGNLSNPVVSLPGGQPDHITANSGWEEWGVVTNPVTGNLIFYTDGQDVFDDQHNLIDIDPSNPGYETLGASCSSGQPVAICPATESYSQTGYGRYYIFSNPTGSIGGVNTIGPITYRFYDAVNKSFGPVQNLPGTYGTTSVTEGMKIVPCDNDSNTLWLITSLFPYTGLAKKYVVYKIYKSVVSFQSVCDMGPTKQILSAGASPFLSIAYTKAKMSYGTTNIGFSLQLASSEFTCQFDNINGQFLTNTIKIYNTGFGELPCVNDIEFSPGGNFLYYTVYTGSTNTLYQIDLQDAVYVPTPIHTYSIRYSGGLGLAPDGLIYHIYDSGYDSHHITMGRILQPDVEYVPGTTVYTQFYQENFQTYSNTMGNNFDEFIIMPTILTGTKESNNPLSSISVFPNPASEIITITTAGSTKDAVVSVLNMEGQMLLQQAINTVKTEIDISGLAKGVYVLKAGNSEGMVVKKVVKE